ncbi:M48 family metallopeptidase [Rhizobiales bacterium Sp-1]|uniref:M48 family metallopeptidase n=2 Tax=Segnochrobactrum spirostomi TaxID=2608987 RepID=A0A6A7Y0L9_9HYPH|nr:M48 family metallopeptidase [Segnochrobactrum spirostomi]
MNFFAPLGRRRQASPMPASFSVEAGGFEVLVRVKIASRARRLTLRVPIGTEGPVLTVPPRVGEDAVRAFLQQHRGWLAERMARRPVPTPFADGHTIPLRGEPHLVRHSGTARGLVRCTRDEDGRAVILVSGDPAALPRRVRDFLRREAESDLKVAVARHAAALGVKVTSLRVRDTVSRWGSCSSSGALSFSWRVVMAPPFVLDYLAAHEVAHLVEMNHSPAFWRIVARLCPEGRRGRVWLRQHGAMLHAVGAVDTPSAGPDLA